MSTTDPAVFEAAGLSPLGAAFYAARNAVIDEKHAKIEAAEAECQAKLKALREQYEADCVTERAA